MLEAPAATSSRLKKQIRTIVEEGDGDRRSVIVRMAQRSPEEDRLVQTAANALRRRNLSLTARDCLPPDREPEKSVTRAMRPPLLRTGAEALKGSLAAQATQAVPSRAPSELRTQALNRLKPLLRSDRIQRSLAKAAPEGAEGGAAQLWASNSVALEMDVDDLVALPEEVPGIAGVYENRLLRVPPIVETGNVPERVLESRASSWGVRKIGALATWGAHDVRGNGVKVAILDTGVDASHPDLEGKVVAWAEFDAEGNEVVGSQPHDDEGHGTHVAGTVAGGKTSGQWIGVAPEAQLCCAKVLGPSGGTDAQIQAAITWAIEQGVDVLSMSLGGLTLLPEMPGTYTQAIVNCLRAGISVVIAIGNEGAQTTGSPGNDIFALAVGATDYFDRPAGFSGGRTQIVYESEFISPDALPLPYSKPDISAPGVAVVSSVPGGDWKAFNGTSMATPHVAGAIALLLSGTRIRETAQPHERAFLVSDLIAGSVEELGESGQDHRYGFGRIDVLQAIDFARERGY